MRNRFRRCMSETAYEPLPPALFTTTRLATAEAEATH